MLPKLMGRLNSVMEALGFNVDERCEGSKQLNDLRVQQAKNIDMTSDQRREWRGSCLDMVFRCGLDEG